MGFVEIGNLQKSFEILLPQLVHGATSLHSRLGQVAVLLQASHDLEPFLGVDSGRWELESIFWDGLRFALIGGLIFRLLGLIVETLLNNQPQGEHALQVISADQIAAECEAEVSHSHSEDFLLLGLELGEHVVLRQDHGDRDQAAAF